MNMAEDFMKNAIDIVDSLLEANVNVTVYNGQLDLIVPTMGKSSFSHGSGLVETAKEVSVVRRNCIEMILDLMIVMEPAHRDRNSGWS